MFMNMLRVTLLVFFLSFASLAVAAPVGKDFSSSKFLDYDFQQEKMVLFPDSVVAISSFENEDNVTAYSYRGDLLWNKTFTAKILSWKPAGDYIFVFSKHRDGYKTFITCMNRYNGDLIWQRP
jgi:hypothetical protein